MSAVRNRNEPEAKEINAELEEGRQPNGESPPTPAVSCDVHDSNEGHAHWKNQHQAAEVDALLRSLVDRHLPNKNMNPNVFDLRAISLLGGISHTSLSTLQFLSNLAISQKWIAVKNATDGRQHPSVVSATPRRHTRSPALCRCIKKPPKETVCLWMNNDEVYTSLLCPLLHRHPEPSGYWGPRNLETIVRVRPFRFRGTTGEPVNESVPERTNCCRKQQ